MPIVVASSFADPQDVAAYKKAIAQGKTAEEALKVGDNGIGKWETSPVAMTYQCAPCHERTGSHTHPIHEERKWPSPTGQRRSVGELRDTMRHRANIKNGAGIDLNPGVRSAPAIPNSKRQIGVSLTGHAHPTANRWASLTASRRS